MRPRNTFGLLAVFAIGVLLRLPAFSRPLLSDDEAIYAATAAAMSRGDQLYRDVVDHKPPAIYHLYQAGEALLGDGHAHGAHLLVLLVALATAALLWRLAAGWPSEGLRGAGAVAAGLYLVFSTTWHDYDALAANCELFLLLPQTAAALLLLRAVERPSSGLRLLTRHLAIGVLVGLSALCKYQGLTFLGVSAGLLAWAVSVAGRGSWRLSWRCWPRWPAPPCRPRCTWPGPRLTTAPRPRSAGSPSTSLTWAPDWRAPWRSAGVCGGCC